MLKFLSIIGFVLLIAAPSRAAFKLKLSDGANTVVIQDGSALDSNPVADVITFMGDLANNGGTGGGGSSPWAVNVTTGIASIYHPGAPEGPFVSGLDLTSINVSSRSGGTLTIWLTDTDFPNRVNSHHLYSEIGGVTDGTVNYDEWLDTSNQEFGETGLHNHMGPFNPGAFSGSTVSLPGNIVDPFSITEKVVITHSRSGQVSSFDANSRVPVPASLVLGILGLGGVVLTKRKVLRLSGGR